MMKKKLSMIPKAIETEQNEKNSKLKMATEDVVRDCCKTIEFISPKE